VHVVDAPNASVVATHVVAPGVPIPLNAVRASATPVTVRAPLFVTVNVYVAVLPGFNPPDGDAAPEIPSECAALGVKLADAGAELTVVVPLGATPVAVAVSTTGTAASTSACVTTRVARQVVEAPGASDVASHVADTLDGEILSPVTLTLPLFTTVNS